MASFPEDFIWGAATSAYQVEGAVREGGRGESIWDRFSHTPGKTKNGDTGDVAADSFHRFREDVELLRQMGLDAYRFSLSWPRIDPRGDLSFSRAGLDYYDALVNALVAAGIEPWITIYHWDLPEALEDSGGWRSEHTARSFAAYAKLVAEHFCGRVKNYITFNEPQCFIGLGYGTGEHAPGLALNDDGLRLCWGNFRLAHTLAAEAIHRADSANRVGIASTGSVFYPDTDDERDVEAARRMTFDLPDGPRTFSHALALEGLTDTLDFIGLNIYHGSPARMGVDGPEAVPLKRDIRRTAMGWPVTPKALEWGPRILWERYGLPVYITENGFSCRDAQGPGGAVHDSERINYTSGYLRSLSEAISAGADVRGYFHWSLIDNFEWAEGLDQRFCLVYVDYQTGRREPKDSAGWYGETARTGGKNL